jgi:hydroxymethylbilane synthase
LDSKHKILKVGTRGSLLAVTQTNQVIDNLKAVNPDIKFEVVIIKTSGDEGKIEVVGAFVKEVEHALIRKEIDLAVHSLKDMPTALPDGVKLGALPIRGQIRDCLISKNNIKLSELKKGAIIGTSSLRRIFQLKFLRPDLNFVPIRGNIITRINKIDNLELDAIILAGAGLERIQMTDRIAHLFSFEEMVPAVAQGILAVETRREDEFTNSVVRKIHSKNSEIQALAERAFLSALGGGCRMPIGAVAEIEGNMLQLIGMLSNEKGSQIETARINGDKNEPEKLGMELAGILLAKFDIKPFSA